LTDNYDKETLAVSNPSVPKQLHYQSSQFSYNAFFERFRI